MKRFLKHTLLLGLLACVGLSLLGFAACGETKTDNISYTVTVTAQDTLILSGVKVQILDKDGNSVEEKDLTNGVAAFSLAPGEYRAALKEKISGVLNGYTYTQPTLTASAPSATITIQTASETEQTQVKYTVTVQLPTGAPVSEIAVQLCGGPEGGEEACYIGITNASGTAEFELAAGNYEVHIAETDWPSGYTFDDTKYKMGPEGGSLTVQLTAK